MDIDKIKFYFSSVMALKKIDDPLDLPALTGLTIDQGVDCYQHLPHYCMASSIEDATEKVREFALSNWRKEDGWNIHHIEIINITKEMYKTIKTAEKAIVLFDFEEEEDRHILF